METQNTALVQRKQQTSSLNLAELHPVMQLACRDAAKVENITAIVANKDILSIGRLQKETSDNDLEKVFRYLLVKMREELHIDNGLSNDNIRNIARRLRTDNEIRWWLSVADIRLLCQKIVNGEYGKFYGHFSEQEFYDCMVKYCNERVDLHSVNADKDVVEYKNVLHEIGYTIDKDGRLVVPEASKGVVNRPTRYLYDSRGNITGENPAYWAGVIHKEEKTPEEMEMINNFNRKTELAKRLMAENSDLKYINAMALAEIEMRNGETTDVINGSEDNEPPF